MQASFQQGIPLETLLGVGGLIHAKILVCQHELEHRMTRSITFMRGYSTDDSGELLNENRLSMRGTLQADQLVLVDFAIPPTDKELDCLLERAASSGCAGLVLHSDQKITFTTAWIQQAETLRLPILSLPPDVLPDELIAPLVEELLRRERALLNQATSVQERMVGQILAGRSCQGIIDLLFTFIGRPVLLADNNGTILGQAGAWHQIPAAEILSNPDKLSSSLARLADHTGQWYGPGGAFGLLTLGQERLYARPLTSGKDILGWLILNTEPDSMDISAKLALDQAAIAATIEIGQLAAIRQVEWRMKANFLDDLLNQNNATGPLEERAQHLGWDLRHKRSVMLVGWDEPKISPQQLRQLESGIVHFIRTWRPESVVLQRENEILILPHLPEANDTKTAIEVLQNLAQNLLKEWPLRLRNISIVIAIGEIQPSLKEIATSYREAQRALAMRKRLGIRYPIISFQDVRIFSILDRHLNDEEILSLYRRTIGPLAEYDAKHQTDLVRTAEAYFDCDYHLQQAADQLLIHPSSLKYRLQRIRDLLDKDPFADKDHMDYYLATKIARLL